MAPLGNGRFIITNSKFKNVAYLADANSYSDLRADAQRGRPGEKWNVVLLKNGNYTIQNHDYSSYATCEDIVKPDVGNRIVGGDRDSQQWKIIEVQGHGNSYVICPTKNRQVCWHLVDEESGTDITLEHHSHTDKIQWKFSPAEESEGSGAVGDDEHDDDDETKYNPFRESGAVGGDEDDKPSLPVVGSIVDLPTLASSRGEWYSISLAGTSLYLTPEGLSSKPPMPNTRIILSNSMPYARMWFLHSFGDICMIIFCAASGDAVTPMLYFSIPEDGEGCLTDEMSELSLTPVGGPNEVRIT